LGSLSRSAIANVRDGGSERGHGRCANHAASASLLEVKPTIEGHAMPIDFTLTPEQRELQLASRDFAGKAATWACAAVSCTSS
jgi:hypothetical protein